MTWRPPVSKTAGVLINKKHNDGAIEIDNQATRCVLDEGIVRQVSHQRLCRKDLDTQRQGPLHTAKQQLAQNQGIAHEQMIKIKCAILGYFK